MKKLTAIIVLGLMILSVVAAGVSAQSINPSGSIPTGTTATVKRADPANVVKDGVIGDGEYEKLAIDTNEETSILHMVFATGDMLEKSEAMLGTMEYYASWCDGAINVAVRAKPEKLQQLLDVKTDGEYPEDWFCQNVAFTISSDVKQTRDRGKVCNFYFAIGKRTDTGAYLLGYYGAEQRGNSDSYIPQAGSDFVIEYDYGTGYVTMEWSIPFSEICDGGSAAAGDSVYLSIGAEAGEGTVGGPDNSEWYAISLGDFTYGVDLKSAFNHAAFELSDDVIEKTGTSPAPDPDPTPTPDPDNPGGGSGNTPAGPSNDQGQTVVIDPDQYEVTTDDEGNEVIVDKETGETGAANTLPVAPAKTGDPMIAFAAVAALSAAGAFIVGKKRR